MNKLETTKSRKNIKIYIRFIKSRTFISLKRYSADFSKLGFWCCIIVIALIFTFPALLTDTVNYLLIKPIGSEYKRPPYLSGYLTDLIIIVLGIGTLIWMIRTILKPILPSLNSLIIAAGILLVYFSIFRNSPYYTFSLSIIPGLQWLAYTDVILISLIIFTRTYRSYRRPLIKKNTGFTLVEDAQLANTRDVFAYSKYTTEISKYIHGTSTTRSSFAIGIIGEWGSGKTFFLKSLLQFLDKKENIIIHFNPWLINKPDAIVEEFFRVLSLELKPFNSSITSKLKDYSKRILQTGKEIHYRILDTLIGEWFQDEDIQKKYESVNTSIQNTGKRLIILIDDIDRLSGKEIMEVLRIIRNTANFANTFFIAALDQQYVVESLSNAKEFAKGEEYLKKIFQLTITLPTFRKSVFRNELDQYLYKGLNDSDINEIKQVIKRLSYQEKDLTTILFPASIQEEIFESCISNMRDLKRFCNSFKIIYNIIKGEIDLNDLVVLELIKCKNLEVYNLLRSKKLLKFDPEKANEWQLDIKLIETNVPIDLRTAVNYLFSEEGYKNERRFQNSVNFHLYFSYQLAGLISSKEFKSTMLKPSDEIIKQFVKWTEESKQDELFRLFSKYNEINNSDRLNQLIKACILMPINIDYWHQFAINLFFNQRKTFQNNIFNNDSLAYKKFICLLMQDESITLYDRALLAEPYLMELARKDIITENPVFDKRSWQGIMYKLFEGQLKNSHTDQAINLTFLYKNIENVNMMGDVKAKILYPLATRKYRLYLLDNEDSFLDYANIFLRPRTDPYDGTFAIEPAFYEIFENIDTFMNQLNQIGKLDLKTKTILQKIIDLIKIGEIDNYLSNMDVDDRNHIEQLLKNRKIYEA